MKGYPLSDLVIRRGEVQVACYQIWMNPQNLIWCSLLGRILRLLQERVATPDVACPIHSRLQALARTSWPARARTRGWGIIRVTDGEREA